MRLDLVAGDGTATGFRSALSAPTLDCAVMASRREYVFTMTPEVAQAAVAPLEQALWEQNQRVFAAMQPGRRVLRWIGATGTLAALAWMAPYLWHVFDPRLAIYAGIFCALFAVFVFVPELDPLLRARARRAVRRAAERSLAPVLRRAPYTIAYALQDGRIETHAQDLGIRYVLELRGLRHAIVSGRIVCVFQRKHWPIPSRIFYAPSDEELEALRAELRGVGVEVVEARPS